MLFIFVGNKHVRNLKGIMKKFRLTLSLTLMTVLLSAVSAQVNYEAKLDFKCKPLNLECRTGLRNIKTELFDRVYALGPFVQDKCERSIGFSSVEVECSIPSIKNETGSTWCGQTKYRIAFNASPGSHLVMTGKIDGILQDDGVVAREWRESMTGNITGYLDENAADERFRGLQYHLWSTVWESQASTCEEDEEFKLANKSRGGRIFSNLAMISAIILLVIRNCV